MSIKLSAYGTCFNTKQTIVPFVENLFSTFSGIDIELVMVDNYSTDGTWETLKELQERYNINLYREKSNRGRGRNIAFEKTDGNYTLSVDADEIFLDTTYKNIIINHINWLDNNSIINFALSKRDVISMAGNWNANLNAAEDVELKARILKYGGRLVGIPAILGADINVLNGEKKGRSGISERRYAKGISYVKRLLDYLTDTVRGYGLKYSDLKYYNGYQKVALLYGLYNAKIKHLEIYRHFESINNLQAEEKAKTRIDPSILQIPKERWVATLSQHIGKTLINISIIQLSKLGYKNIYRDSHNIEISYLPRNNLNKSIYKIF